ncbi:MAG TPA: bacillithiol biosynthesis cysteine-adding enzyme BshC [Flavisolibacter sp.]|nr:bacillithiol biosynthesis cysteine-adding enzyme BshC [Flavisolibacter sp.]
MFAARQMPYHQTNSFSKIVLDYLEGDERLRSFYSLPPTLAGIEQAIEKKKQQGLDRTLLVNRLKEQYGALDPGSRVRDNIEALLSENTFTITTAHQPNLFTGPLYFIYKIVHAIKLADELSRQLPLFRFVPVYYMGSEDADFAELNHTYVDGKKIEWQKEQTGAVGRMIVDQTLVRLINELEGQLYGREHSAGVIDLLRRCYMPGRNIQAATFELVHELYASYGLIVLIPDDAELKSRMKTVFSDDLFHHKPFEIVSAASDRLSEHYEPQAHAREINLFYLRENIRERIERKNGRFEVVNTAYVFSDEEMRMELDRHPERFSPNVILRGLYQASILPDVAFIGGGGELAYWLQLKELFDHYHIVYPALVLRNSFLIVEEKWQELMTRIGLDVESVFQDENSLMRLIVEKHSTNAVSLNGNFEKADALFEQIKTQAGAIDPTLLQHVAAIKARSLKSLQELEKKMLRAEKRKFGYQQHQLSKLKEALFPRGGLQERVENFSSFHASWGSRFIDELYRHAPSLEQRFTILEWAQ